MSAEGLHFQRASNTHAIAVKDKCSVRQYSPECQVMGYRSELPAQAVGVTVERYQLTCTG